MTEFHASVIGGGAWGTALAIHLARLGTEAKLWVWESELVERMRTRRDNPVYLPGVPIPESVRPVADLEEAVDGAGLVVAAVPSPFARRVYSSLSGSLKPDVPLVLAAKGIEEETLALPADVARSVLGSDRPCAVLSGPSFAVEVAGGQPTAAVVAAEREELAAGIQARMSGRNLRLYTNPDITGVQLAGALKNVIALAAGMVDGLGLGQNTLAALLTRGLAEMTRLGLALGGQPSTFSGLAGIGDLVLTCSSPLSRNRSVGHALGRGERLADVLAKTRTVAEGVRTTRSARALGRRAGVEMPIVEEVFRILYEECPPGEALERLMSRPLTAEDRVPAESET